MRPEPSPRSFTNPRTLLDSDNEASRSPLLSDRHRRHCRRYFGGISRSLRNAADAQSEQRASRNGMQSRREGKGGGKAGKGEGDACALRDLAWNVDLAGTKRPSEGVARQEQARRS
jgi:hypothetical protein